jgi:hypothetical protein
VFFKKPIHRHFDYTALVALALIIVSDFWNLGVEVFPSGTLERAVGNQGPDAIGFALPFLLCQLIKETKVFAHVGSHLFRSSSLSW